MVYHENARSAESREPLRWARQDENLRLDVPFHAVINDANRRLAFIGVSRSPSWGAST